MISIIVTIILLATKIVNQNLLLKSEEDGFKLWAQSKTETEIARELHCNVSNICRDIKFFNYLNNLINMKRNNKTKSF